MYVSPPPGVTKAHLDVSVAATEVRIGLKGNPPFLRAPPAGAIDNDLSTWTICKDFVSLLVLHLLVTVLSCDCSRR